jgi:hypothetical protein
MPQKQPCCQIGDNKQLANDLALLSRYAKNIRRSLALVQTHISKKARFVIKL